MVTVTTYGVYVPNHNVMRDSVMEALGNFDHLRFFKEWQQDMNTRTVCYSTFKQTGEA